MFPMIPLLPLLHTPAPPAWRAAGKVRDMSERIRLRYLALSGGFWRASSIGRPVFSGQAIRASFSYGRWHFRVTLARWPSEIA